MRLKPSFARNLSVKIVLMSYVLLSIVLTAITILEVRLASKRSVENLKARMEYSAERIQTEFDVVKNLADNTALLIEWVPLTQEAFQETLDKMLESNPHIFSASAHLDPEWTFKYKMFSPTVMRDVNTGQNKFEMISNYDTMAEYSNVYDSVMNMVEESPWVGPYGGSKNGVWEISYLVKTGSRNPHGVKLVETEITLDWLMDCLEEVKITESSQAYLISRDSVTFCMTDIYAPAETKDLRSGMVDLFKIDLNVVDCNDSTYQFRIDPKTGSLVGEARLDNGWTLGVSCPKREVFADVVLSVNNMGLGLLVCLVLIFIFSITIIHRKTRPLKKFAEASSSIAKGDFDTALPVIKNKDEVWQLSDAFIKMQISLKQYIMDLTETTAKNQRMESELSIASEIQSQVLRKDFPVEDKYGIYATMQPAKEVGGDFYDFLRKGDKLYFCIGDVSGKGVPAALVMTTATMIFRHICATTDMSLSEIVSGVNNTIADGNDAGFFATFLAACIDLNTREMTFCNAGHNLMLRIGADGKTDFVKARPNIACGLFPDFPYVQESLALSKGDRIVFYTDGIDEAMNTVGDQFGNERLLQWAIGANGCPGEKQLVDSLIDKVHDFTLGAEQSDDITVITVTVK